MRKKVVGPQHGTNLLGIWVRARHLRPSSLLLGWTLYDFRYPHIKDALPEVSLVLYLWRVEVTATLVLRPAKALNWAAYQNGSQPSPPRPVWMPRLGI